MNAKVDIRIGTSVKLRQWEDRFKVTEQLNDAWKLETDLENYELAIDGFLPGIFNYFEAQATVDPTAILSARYAITLENVTAPTPAAGSIVQAKRHLDGALTAAQLENSDYLRQILLNAITELSKSAKYS